ncbi:MAG TPA: response regulator, partial [Steroidobacteraceae bacterium]|nr:response regulator [Steroidobacteraceae bacterium]
GMLTSLGLTVTCAPDGQQGLARYAERRPDLILMDCQMPVLDGYGAALEIRRLEQGGPRVPIIALTADATSAARQACLEAGMDDYLSKPFTRDALRTVLARWLAPASAAAPPPGVPAGRPAAAPLDAQTLETLRALPRRGARSMLEHIARLYLAESSAQLAGLKRALDEGDPQRLARAAHGWASSNGNVGALHLARLCRGLEEQARRNDLRAARAGFAQLQHEYDRVHAALQAEVSDGLRRSA